MAIQKGSFLNFLLLCTCQIGCSLTSVVEKRNLLLGAGRVFKWTPWHNDVILKHVYYLYLIVSTSLPHTHQNIYTCSLQTIDCASWHQKNSLSYVKVDGKATPHWRQLADHIGPPSFRVFGSLDGLVSFRVFGSLDSMVLLQTKWFGKREVKRVTICFLAFLCIHTCFCCFFTKMPF